MHGRTVVWFPRYLQAQCHEEGTDKYPNETGGVLMGYWWDPDSAVVTGVIGPGAAAIHEPHSFEPDITWQRSAIAEHYARSGRRESYLGDWHTHPGAATAALSRMDRRALRKIIATPKARAPTPLMAIFFDGAPQWRLRLVQASAARRLPLFPDKLLIADVVVSDY